jgi:hypothetical protein
VLPQSRRSRTSQKVGSGRKTQQPPLVIDGPFAETKEQLLGLYIIDVADLQAALEIAREQQAAAPARGRADQWQQLTAALTSALTW